MQLAALSSSLTGENHQRTHLVQLDPKGFSFPVVNSLIYLEPLIWLGLHSILIVTLAGGCDNQSCWGTRGLIFDVCPYSLEEEAVISVLARWGVPYAHSNKDWSSLTTDNASWKLEKEKDDNQKDKVHRTHTLVKLFSNNSKTKLGEQTLKSNKFSSAEIATLAKAPVIYNILSFSLYIPYFLAYKTTGRIRRPPILSAVILYAG